MLESAALLLPNLLSFASWGELFWLDVWSGSKSNSSIKWSHERGESAAGKKYEQSTVYNDMIG